MADKTIKQSIVMFYQRREEVFMHPLVNRPSFIAQFATKCFTVGAQGGNRTFTVYTGVFETLTVLVCMTLLLLLL